MIDVHCHLENKDFDVREILKKPIFVPESMKISNLLKDLQLSKLHMAIVLDERANFQGLITVEDILEELVGEIWDEHDDVEEEVEEINEGQFILDGELSINDFNDLFEDIKDVEPDSASTIAGYVMEILEKIPELYEECEDQNFKFKVIEKNGNKIEKIHVGLKELKENNED